MIFQHRETLRPEGLRATGSTNARTSPVSLMTPGAHAVNLHRSVALAVLAVLIGRRATRRRLPAARAASAPARAHESA